MSKQQYIQKRIRPAGLEMIRKIDEISSEYVERGYKLTVRQAYYQMVSRGLLENCEKSYDLMIRLINDGRFCGLLNWSIFEDRIREAHGRYDILEVEPHDLDIEDIRWIINYRIDNFHLHSWTNQPFYVEVWIEKSALESVIARAAEKHDIPYLAVRGYSSSSALKEAADMFIRHADQDQKCILLYLGDLDPSGDDIPRCIQEKLKLLGADVAVERIALNLNQVKQYGPPPAPVKKSDKRAPRFIEKFGESVWELDALGPDVLEELVSSTVAKYFDQDIYAQLKEYERSEITKTRERLAPVIDTLNKLTA